MRYLFWRRLRFGSALLRNAVLLVSAAAKMWETQQFPNMVVAALAEWGVAGHSTVIQAFPRMLLKVSIFGLRRNVVGELHQRSAAHALRDANAKHSRAGQNQTTNGCVFNAENGHDSVPPLRNSKPASYLCSLASGINQLLYRLACNLFGIW